MIVPTDVLVCVATAVGTGIMGFLSLAVHLLIRISSDVGGLKSRAAVDEERYTNVGLRLQGLENRFDLKGA